MPVRVYLEDTDAGGIVYHASYLRFMERARTEWLRASGIGLDDWQVRGRVLFVVRSITMDYLKPARLDDRLEVRVDPVTVRRASLICEQPVLRGAETLTRARVRLACIDADTALSGRPTALPIPDAIREAMNA